MPSYPLLGGPCDGRTSANYASEPATGTTISCGGGTYRYDRGNPNVFVFLPTTGIGGGSGGDARVDTHQIGRRWHRLMHALAVVGPYELKRTRAHGKRAKRGVR